jgi:hypothetical protein
MSKNGTSCGPGGRERARPPAAAALGLARPPNAERRPSLCKGGPMRLVRFLLSSMADLAASR